jgi:hypothetical protein
MFLPAGRFLTNPFPPGRPPVFAPLFARFLAAVILPPLLFFAIFSSTSRIFLFSFYFVSHLEIQEIKRFL